MPLTVLPTILIPSRYYLPAFKAGGPVRSLEALIHRLGGEFRFKVLTSSCDLGESVPYPGIRMDQWNRVGPAEVMYLSPGHTGPRAVIAAIRETDFDLLYLNSFFDLAFTLGPLFARRSWLIPPRPAILAPRGELSPGAMAQKTRKKAVFLRIARTLGLYGKLTWHASTTLERDEITAALKKYLGPVTPAPAIRVARNLTALDAEQPLPPAPPKHPGRLRAIFLSRVAPKKNLRAAIEFLSRVRGEEITLDIYGEIDDPAYWTSCQAAIHRGAPTLRVDYKGPLAHPQVLPVFARHDVFLFPTLGENFGHAILEALTAGCPVLTSDRTPWRGLEARHAGWDLPLDASGRFVAVLQELADAGEDALRPLREGARALALATLADPQAIEANRNLFSSALVSRRGPLKMGAAMARP